MALTHKTRISNKHDSILLRDWGAYFQNKGNNEIAISYLKESMQTKHYKNAISHYYLSLAQNAETHAREALENAAAARKTRPLRRYHELEIKTMIDNNRFEAASVIGHDYINKFKDSNTDQLKSDLCLAKHLVSTTCTNELRKFFIRNPWISKYEEKRKQLLIKKSDRQPLWKKLRAENDCDVVSVLEEEVAQESPVKKAKKALMFKIVAQTYLHRSWRDIVFLKKLKLDKKIKDSLPKLNDFIADQYGKTKVFMKILHERNPMYTFHADDETNHIKAKLEEDHKYRLQYQAHRDALAILRELRALRELKAIKRMRIFMEDVVTKYLCIKTIGIIPGYLELVTEIYNIYALTVVESYVVPTKLLQIPSAMKMHVLLKIDSAVHSAPNKFRFGDKSTVIDLTDDYGMSAYKNKLSSLENRLPYTKHAIERCYLYHEIAHLNILYRRSFEAVFAATQAVLLAHSMKHSVWEMLGLLAIVKAYTIIGKFGQERKALEMCLDLAEKLKSQRLIAFLRLCIHVSQVRTTADVLEARESTTSSRKISSNNSTDSGS